MKPGFISYLHYDVFTDERFAGSLAKVRTRKPINGQRNFRGRVTGARGRFWGICVTRGTRTFVISNMPFQISKVSVLAAAAAGVG